MQDEEALLMSGVPCRFVLTCHLPEVFLSLPDLSVWCLNSGESQLLLTVAQSLRSVLYEDVNRVKGEQQRWPEIKET